MNTSLRAHLHYGRVDIGVQRGVFCQARASLLSRACRNLSEGSSRAFHGRNIAPAFTSRVHGRHIQRAQRCPVKTSALFGFFKNDTAERTRKKYQAEVDAINRLEPQMQKLSDEQLAQKTHELKQKAQSTGSVDALLVEAFAVSHTRRLLLTFLQQRI